MDRNRPCGCKGRRSCLICEAEYQIIPTEFMTREDKENGYVYCHLCQKAWPGWDCDVLEAHPNHTGESIDYPGVYIETDFITKSEKEELLEGINNDKWDLSQSGRRKQNYGPKCNFKKNKIQTGSFSGFPKFSKFVTEKFEDVDILKNYSVIEQCSLEYDPVKGASIDPHIDDCWIWGERIITVNVLGDTFLTMTRYKGDKTKYNLDKVTDNMKVVENTLNDKSRNLASKILEKGAVRIWMPERSLIVLYGEARYEWEHCVLREDVKNKRICLAYREFTPDYLPGGKYENIGKEILEISKRFF